ncbi:60S acidic ribosomal protein P2-like [Amphibalanus amphitrite]|nr:60S acidic ribosomal protein P2-like [Amphibalanus amphitrite]XP_043237154.1 60S acidic ribosomal protein P2-like [Amphibalanus amphitrite]
MRYVAAYLLAAQSGKAPSKDDIKKILGSVGIECEDSRADLVVSQMAGKKVDDVIAAGLTKLASVPSGGAAAPAAAAAGGAAPAAAKEEEKKKPEPESESEDDDMGFGLFD